MKKGAIFDMDGTIFNTETVYRQAWMWAAAHMGYFAHPQQPIDISAVSGPRVEQIIHHYYPGADVDKMCRMVVERFKVLSANKLELMKGAKEILEYLKENGVKISMGSSAGYELINGNIKKAGLEQYFDSITSGQDVKNGKPAPDIFLLAAERLGLPIEDCYVFEDSLNGVKAGLASGAATVMVVDLSQPDEQAKKECAGIYNSMFEVIEALKAEKI